MAATINGNDFEYASHRPGMSRRAFLLAAASAAATLALPDLGMAGKKRIMPLRFYHTHTGERMVVDYRPGSYGGSVRQALEHFLRDFRTGEVHPLDGRLFDSLCAIQKNCGKPAPFEIISGYRSPKTNAGLRRKSSGVASKSLHMQGRAIDIRVAGLSTKKLRDIALDVHEGGVGYYPQSQFIHIDTGRKRSW